MGTSSGQVTDLIGVDYVEKVVEIIDQAKSEIFILMFDWRWYTNGLGSPTQNFNQSLVRASRRGVKVACLVNSLEISKKLEEVGLKAKQINSRNLLHSKLVLVDNTFVVIGSHNISSHAFEKNFETSVLINCPALAENYKNYFNSLWRL